ncbi:SGNH/GDSL hydrolase family protein [Alkalicoccobacillus porphyridii]|uniref:SGNH/GDSL hydrolase family protein n=1 Tax=Alkalicoccobacillus porphyridii TaxID=2597270 RepID=A0A554A0S1_9BACI|nr:SGNH/GDSL hydrolase family protein [Alkalicoccobacillus porphyridii]TSB47291.1 SGNH/GDSL hydrolase family protein [Alkalicoccobacillus porphyridii]
MEWKIQDKLILIGDSITENGRFEDPEDVGIGYASFIHHYLTVKHPEAKLQILNKGISGDRITDLEARWDRDVLAHKPDWVSISIGINDVWKQFEHPEMEQVDIQRFEQTYEYLIKQTLEQTEAKIILMEPTIIEEHADSDENLALKSYVEVVHRLAETYKLLLVPTHQAFISYLNSESPVPLTTDGVHMNTKGDILMASTWLETFYKG